MVNMLMSKNSVAIRLGFIRCYLKLHLLHGSLESRVADEGHEKGMLRMWVAIFGPYDTILKIY